jgi:hypothetical protein
VAVALLKGSGPFQYGFALFAAVMLGAIFTHYTHNETSRLPFNLILLVLSFIIVFVRRPSFLKRA